MTEAVSNNSNIRDLSIAKLKMNQPGKGDDLIYREPALLPVARTDLNQRFPPIANFWSISECAKSSVFPLLMFVMVTPNLLSL